MTQAENERRALLQAQAATLRTEAAEAAKLEIKQLLLLLKKEACNALLSHILRGELDSSLLVQIAVSLK